MSEHVPSVVSVNVSPGGIPKVPISAGRVLFAGLQGDGHNHDKHNTPVQAISIIDREDLDDLQREGFDVYPGATGENITVQHLDVDSLDVGDRLRFSGGVEVELTKRRKPCYVLDAISPQLKHNIIGRCGYLARVTVTGTVQAGESIELVREKSHAAHT